MERSYRTPYLEDCIDKAHNINVNILVIRAHTFVFVICVQDRPTIYFLGAKNSFMAKIVLGDFDRFLLVKNTFPEVCYLHTHFNQ